MSQKCCGHPRGCLRSDKQMAEIEWGSKKTVPTMGFPSPRLDNDANR